MCILSVDYYTQCGCKYPRKENVARCGPWMSEQVRERARQLRKKCPPRNWWGSIKQATKEPDYEPCFVIEGDEVISGYCSECTARGPVFMENKRAEWARKKIELDHTHPPFYDYVNDFWFPTNSTSSNERKSHSWLCSRCEAAELKPHPTEKAKNPYELCCNWCGALQEWNKYRGFPESPESSPPGSQVYLGESKKPSLHRDWQAISQSVSCCITDNYSNNASTRSEHKPPAERGRQLPCLSGSGQLSDDDNQQNELEAPHPRPRQKVSQATSARLPGQNRYKFRQEPSASHQPVAQKLETQGATVLSTQASLPPPTKSYPNSSLQRTDHTRRRIAPRANDLDILCDGQRRSPSPILSRIPGVLHDTLHPPGQPSTCSLQRQQRIRRTPSLGEVRVMSNLSGGYMDDILNISSSVCSNPRPRTSPRHIPAILRPGQENSRQHLSLRHQEHYIPSPSSPTASEEKAAHQTLEAREHLREVQSLVDQARQERDRNNFHREVGDREKRRRLI
jgi:hypothetical protein